MASICRRIGSGRPARTKRMSQGRNSGRWRQRMKSGPIGSSSQRGALNMRPGPVCGRQECELIAPALPKEVMVPGGSGSISVTLQPSRRR